MKTKLSRELETQHGHEGASVYNMLSYESGGQVACSLPGLSSASRLSGV